MPNWITGPATPTYAIPAQVAASVPKLGSRPDLADLIAVASQRIDDECRRSFLAADLVEVIDGNHRPKIWLSQPPINSIASITMDGESIDNTLNTGWSFHPTRGTVVRGSNYCDPRWLPLWAKGLGNIVVSYNGGYPSIPTEILRATIILTNHIATLTKWTGSMKSESLGDESFDIADLSAMAMPGLVMSLISRFILDPIA